MTFQFTQSPSDYQPRPLLATGSGRLQRYYFVRAGFSVAWVAAAFTIGRSDESVAAALLIAYPAWDAVANLVDAERSGGLRRNPTQLFNTLVSVVTTAAVAFALFNKDMYLVSGIFGVWAVLSGVLQLATGIRRWKSYGAQWAMILSGAQSSLAGIHFVTRALGTTTPSVADVAPYAAFGAFYFLVSAISLTWVILRSERTYA